jgi:hypothetical protein
LGINALADSNKKHGAGQTKTDGKDGNQCPSPVSPNATPSQSGYHFQTFSCSVIPEGAKRLSGIQEEELLLDTGSRPPEADSSGMTITTVPILFNIPHGR